MLIVVKLFLNGMNTNGIGKREQVIKHLHGNCVVGDFDKKFLKAIFGLDTELFYLLSYTNQYLSTLYITVISVTTDI